MKVEKGYLNLEFMISSFLFIYRICATLTGNLPGRIKHIFIYVVRVYIGMLKYKNISSSDSITIEGQHIELKPGTKLDLLKWKSIPKLMYTCLCREEPPSTLPSLKMT